MIGDLTHLTSTLYYKVLSTSAIFDSARQKLIRAKQHTVELESMEKSFFETESSGVIRETEPATGDQFVKIRFRHTIPLEMSSVVSDIANNLRDALDHIGYATAIAGGKSDTKCANFPFGKTSEDLEHSIRRRSKDIPNDILALFRAFKPYKGGNDLLYALNSIANTKKHRVLSPMAVSTGGIYFKSARVSGGSLTMPFGFGWNSGKNEIELMRCGKNAKLDYSMEVTVVIAFDKSILGAEYPAGPMFDEITSEVEMILTSVEAECRRIGLII